MVPNAGSLEPPLLLKQDFLQARCLSCCSSNNVKAVSTEGIMVEYHVGIKRSHGKRWNFFETTVT